MINSKTNQPLNQKPSSDTNWAHLEILLNDVDGWNRWYQKNKSYGVDWRGVDLHQRSLLRVDLSGVDLSWADLSQSDLRRADLSGACLVDADLRAANLAGANLLGADLTGANLSSANLSGAILSRALLVGANLLGANLSRVKLIEANLKDALLSQESLKRYYGRSIQLLSANLSRSNLQRRALRSEKSDDRDPTCAELNSLPERTRYAPPSDFSVTDPKKRSKQEPQFAATNLKDALLDGAILPDGTVYHWQSSSLTP